jgi:hypothetical protein
MDHEIIWLEPGEIVLESEQHIIQSPKLMITIPWNTNGFHVIEVLSKCTKFNTGYYTTGIFERIKEW